MISARGELQASADLRDAAKELSKYPASLQLRFLQTATDIAAENNSTTLFPLPVDFGGFRGLMRKLMGESEVEEPDPVPSVAGETERTLPAPEEAGVLLPAAASEEAPRHETQAIERGTDAAKHTPPNSP